MMTDVRRSVYKATNGQQLPWTNSSLLGQFYFKAPAAGAVDPRQKARDEKLARLEADAKAWEAVRNSTDPATIRNVLATLSNGPYAELARARLATLEAESKQAGQSVEVALADKGNARAASADSGGPDARPDPALIRSIQKELQRAGCDPGAADGMWGRKSRSALGEFSRNSGVDLASLEPTAPLLEELKRQDGRVCPLACGTGQIEKSGQCVAMPTTSTPTKSASSAPSRPARQPSSSNCFRFNGQLVCD